jgi:tRNA(Ile)-lysidine synthase
VLEAVKKTINKYNLLREKDFVLIALSGGPDSLTLLHILSSLKDSFDLKLHIAHFNHKIRGKAAEYDVRFIKRTAKDFNLGLSLASKDISKIAKEKKLSLEEAGRIERYKFLEKLALSLDVNKIALGHTANDQIETVLFRIVRGSGVKGLAGIPVKRPVSKRNKNIFIIRPLIEIWRDRIEEYIASYKLKPVFDITNDDTNIIRNRIRKNLIPLLETKYNSAVKKNLFRLADIMSEEDDYLEARSGDWLRKNIKYSDKKIEIGISTLKKCSRALFPYVISKSINLISDTFAPTNRHIKDIYDLAHFSTAGKEIQVKADVIIKKKYKYLSFEKIREVGAVRKRRIGNLKTLLVTGGIFEPSLGYRFISSVHEINPNIVKRFKNNKKKYVAYFDRGKINGDLGIRAWRSGDKIHPLGMKGTKKLQDIFTDNKVLKEERFSLPILVCGDRVVWVVGHCVSDDFKITPRTKSVVCVKAIKTKT